MDALQEALDCPDSGKPQARTPAGDFIADNQAELYYVSVDVDGEIGWESGTFCNRGRNPAHVIEVLTAASVSCRRKTGRVSVKRNGTGRRWRTASDLFGKECG